MAYSRWIESDLYIFWMISDEPEPQLAVWVNHEIRPQFPLSRLNTADGRDAVWAELMADVKASVPGRAASVEGERGWFDECVAEWLAEVSMERKTNDNA